MRDCLRLITWASFSLTPTSDQVCLVWALTPTKEELWWVGHAPTEEWSQHKNSFVRCFPLNDRWRMCVVACQSLPLAWLTERKLLFVFCRLFLGFSCQHPLLDIWTVCGCLGEPCSGSKRHNWSHRSTLCPVVTVTLHECLQAGRQQILGCCCKGRSTGLWSGPSHV